MPAQERERRRSEAVTRTELVLPPMTNSHGTMYGGRVLEMMDMTCGIAAMRFCRGPVVTVSSERVDFKVPIRAGYIVELNARVVFTGRTSMTVKVEVFSQPVASSERRLCTVGFFNFVALDITGKTPVVVPELVVKTEEEMRDYQEAERLRQARLLNP
jgi:acyl-CoA hydrolase